MAFARLRKIPGLLVPYSVVIFLRTREDRERRRRVGALLAQAPARAERAFSYDEALALLLRRGLDEQAVRLGTIDPGSLAFVRATILSRFPRGAPLRGLHIGNFAGISLAALSSALREVDDASLTVSIDPNIPHLGLHDLQSHAVAVLAHFGLLRSNLVLCGYTFEKTPGTDGLAIPGYDMTEAWDREAAPENVLPNLEHLGLRFDVALLDGSHIGSHAKRDLDVLVRMVVPGGLILLDDVTETWSEIEAIFEEAADRGPTG